MRLSLRTRLVLIACAVLLLAMAANTWVNGLVFAREYSNAVLSRAYVIGDTLTSQLDRLLSLNIPVSQLIGFEEQLKEALARHDFLSYLMVATPGGEVLFHSEPRRRSEMITDSAVLAHVRLPTPSSDVWSNSEGVFYEVFTPVTHRGEHVATVRIGFPAQFVRGKVARMITYSVAVTLLFAGLGVAALVVSINAWVSKPLERFIQAGETATSEGAGLVSPAAAPTDEMGRLSETFDAMLADLQRQRSELLKANSELECEIAERKRAEEEVRAHAAALEAKNSELDSFVYVVSHDLKSPLVTIQEMASMLVQDQMGRLDEQGRHYLERIGANVSQMKRLIGDLLALSRAGREARSAERIAMNEVVDEVLAALSEQIRARGVKVTYGELGTVIAVRMQMLQVWSNLLSNAVKYIGDTPDPTVEIGCAGGGEVPEYWVRDNGIGIDPAYHAQVFEMFQRLKDVEAEGTGVGLPIAKKIVEASGGRIWVESAKGQGATFRFTWPRTEGSITYAAGTSTPTGVAPSGRAAA